MMGALSRASSVDRFDCAEIHEHNVSHTYADERFHDETTHTANSRDPDLQAGHVKSGTDSSITNVLISTSVLAFRRRYRERTLENSQSSGVSWRITRPFGLAT